MREKFSKISGILLVNKPAGLSSAEVLRKIKFLYKIDKVGHAGTLDPFATGLLIFCLNRATVLSNFFLSGEKKYNGILRLGINTDTQDLTGNIISVNNLDHLNCINIFKVFSIFSKYIYQYPSCFSALKYRGTRLYELARKGIYIYKLPRCVCIFSINIIKIQLPDVFFNIMCSSGTYIRSICFEIGRMLGCGGHLYSLRRVACSNFSVKDSYSLKYLESISMSDLSFDKFHSCILPITNFF